MYDNSTATVNCASHLYFLVVITGKNPYFGTESGCVSKWINESSKAAILGVSSHSSCWLCSVSLHVHSICNAFFSAMVEWLVPLLTPVGQ